MADSVHLGRWLEQFEDSNHEFIIFPSSPHRRIQTKVWRLLDTGKFSMSWGMRFMALPLWLIDRALSDWLRGCVLALEVSRVRPDLIHVLEFQNGGYPYLRARKLSRALAKVPLLLTPYGSDMYWFRRFPNHKRKLEALLGAASALSCECRRDELIAVELGFTGALLPRIPAFGNLGQSKGMDTSRIRKSIVMKGYQNKWGRALCGIEALRLVERDLIGYQVHLFSCNFRTIVAARAWRRESGLEIITYKKNSLSHERVQELMSNALIYIGLSVSDGISASMIEAMSNGAIPIQSNTSCCDEWLDNGVGGFLVDFDDVTTISHLVKFVLKNPEFSKAAAIANRYSLDRKLNFSDLEKAAHATYSHFEPR